MPTVLITGLNGFVAVHAAARFLRGGWDVRGTVRSADKGDKVLALPIFAHYVGTDRLSFVVLKDMVNDDYSDALAGVHAVTRLSVQVAHLAAPFTFAGKSWLEYRDPSITATVRVMEAAAKVPSVKAFALMSTAGAINEPGPWSAHAGKVYTEDDWSPLSEKFAEDTKDPGNGGNFAQVVWYFSGKKLAEEAAVETYKKLGDPYCFTRLCPPMIYGPAYHMSSAADLAAPDISTYLLYASVAAGSDKSVPDTRYPPWVDVRDLVEGLFVTITQKKAGRYILSSGTTDFDGIARAAAAYRPDLDQAGFIPKHAKKEESPLLQGTFDMDCSKAKRELGITFRPLEALVRDVVDQFEKLGAYTKTTAV